MGRQSRPAHTRALWLSGLGFVIAAIGAAMVNSGWYRQFSTATLTGSYHYYISQDASATVSYQDSSFYNSKPDTVNTAYISDLTKDLTAKYHYNFNANTKTNLTTTYSIDAQVKSNYALKGDSEDPSNVWQQTYPLVAPKTSTVNSSSVTVDETVTVPYAEYKQAANNFRTALTLPTSSEVVVVFNVMTKGEIDGRPFEDTRVSTISAPLEEQIYQPKVKFDKEASKQIVGEEDREGQAAVSRVKIVAGAIIMLLGSGLIIFGLRKRIFKTAYQRELDRIYRYHDGLIVRTSRPIDLTDHQVIPMRSFEDMLNLEEELKKPIIADEISSTLTHFLIASSNVLYLYKLQAQDAKKSDNLAAEEVVAEPIASPAPTTEKVRTYGLASALQPAQTTDGIRPAPKRPLGPVSKKPSTSATKESNELDDIIDELAKKPTKKSKKS